MIATQDIPKNTKLADYVGIKMTLKDFKQQYGNDIFHTYSMRRINKIISGKNHFNISHYMNESLTPNVALKQRGIYTLKPITNGEEMFLKYPKTYIRDYKL